MCDGTKLGTGKAPVCRHGVGRQVRLRPTASAATRRATYGSAPAGSATGYDGVHIFAPDGRRIGLIKLPEICANLCFGGTRRNQLLMTASQCIYLLPVETRGAHFC